MSAKRHSMKACYFCTFVKEVVLNPENWPVFVHHIKEYVFICLCAMLAFKGNFLQNFPNFFMSAKRHKGWILHGNFSKLV